MGAVWRIAGALLKRKFSFEFGRVFNLDMVLAGLMEKRH